MNNQDINNGQHDYIVEDGGNFRRVSFPDEDVVYLPVTWEYLNDSIFQLAKKIIQDRNQGKLPKVDRIVSLARAGWPMTISLMDLTEIEKFASIGVKSYLGINEQAEQPKVYQDLSISVQGEDILLFDDIVDTGSSFEFINQYLRKKGAQRITSASLFCKPHSKYKVEYFARKTEDWIILPHEFVETAKLLTKKWSEKKLDKSEMKIRLQSLNFSNEWIDFYFSELAHNFSK